MGETAKQRAALHVLELLAQYPPTLRHTWNAEEIADLMIEIAKIELGFRRVALASDPRACKGLARETGRQVQVRRVKGVN